MRAVWLWGPDLDQHSMAMDRTGTGMDNDSEQNNGIIYSSLMSVGSYAGFAVNTAGDAAATVSNSVMQYLSDIMTTRDEEGSEKKELTGVSFNQDCSALAVGHDEGYVLYSLKSLDDLEKIYECPTPTRAYIVERLFGSSLICLVSTEQSRKLSVYHFVKNNEICCHGYASAVLAVRMNRKRVVVCLEESIHVHNITDMRLLHVIKDTPTNPSGLLDLSPDASACYLAYPGSTTTGNVHIFDADSLTASCVFAAHEGPLAAMKFSPDGKKIATASQKGTVIRVFQVDGVRLCEFTRGMKRCVSIHCLAFNTDATLLCSSSNTETVHVFSLVRPEATVELQKTEENQEGISSWVNYFSQQATAYLPQHMNELMLREKSLCTAHLPMAGTRTVVGIPRIGDKDYLMAATSDGYLFCYTIESGGNECSLLRQFRIGPKYGDEKDAPAGSSVTVTARRPPSNAQLIDFDEATRPAASSSGSVPRHSPSNSSNSSGSSNSKHSTSPPLPSTEERIRRTSASVPPFGVSPANSSSSSGKSPPSVPPPPAISSTAAAKPTRMSPPTTNAFDDISSSEDESSGNGLGGLPHADLNDMDEFPPLFG